MKRSWHSSTGKLDRQERPARLRRSALGDFLLRAGMRVSQAGRLRANVLRSKTRVRGAALLAGCLVAFTVVPSPAGEIPLADFARHAQYDDVKISR
jgi:hypothetical protein